MEEERKNAFQRRRSADEFFVLRTIFVSCVTSKIPKIAANFALGSTTSPYSTRSIDSGLTLNESPNLLNAIEPTWQNYLGRCKQANFSEAGIWGRRSCTTDTIWSWGSFQYVFFQYQRQRRALRDVRPSSARNFQYQTSRRILRRRRRTQSWHLHPSSRDCFRSCIGISSQIVLC